MTSPHDVGRSRLRIAKLECAYRIDGRIADRTAIAARLDAIAERDLPRAVAGILGSVVDDNNPAMVFIRSVDLEISLDPGLDCEALAKGWARILAHKVCKVLARIRADGGAGMAEDGEVAVFRDPATYLAVLIDALAHGGLNQRWYFARETNLRGQHVPAAIRDAMLARPATDGLAALASFAPPARWRMVRMLPETTAREIVGYLVGTSNASVNPRSSDLDLAWKCREASEFDLPRRPRPWAETLHLLAETQRLAPASSPSNIVPAARAVLAFLREARGGGEDETSEERVARLFRAIRRRNAASLYRLSRDFDNAEALQTMFAASEKLLSTIESVLGLGAQSAAKGEGIESARTRHGGIFLLLRDLAELPLADWISGWTSPADSLSAESLLRGLIAAKCLGVEDPRQFQSDAVICRVLNLRGSSLDWAELAEWSATIDSEALLTCHYRWRRRRGDVDCADWYAVNRVVFDGAHGHWLLRAENNDVVPKSFSGNFLDDSNPRWWCDENGLKVCREALPGADSRPVAEDDSERTKRRLVALGTEIDYLNGSAWGRMAAAFNGMLDVLAQGVLRAFARRLPGFATSSLPFLFENFLAVSARLEPSAGRGPFVVHLGRPPLHVILSLTGMARASFRVAWLQEELALFDDS